MRAHPLTVPDENSLLSRDDFKRLVFARSDGKCVFCELPAVDPHHILERKLFPDGGYYLGNGAAVCETHHWDAETTVLSVESVRAAAGITTPQLPPGFSPACVYDKWGNQAWPSGLRTWGPLEQDVGVRRALAQGGVMQLMMPSGYVEACSGYTA